MARVTTKSTHTLTVTSSKVVLHDRADGPELWSLDWEEVDEIVAYKVDALTVDHICLGFRRRGEDTYLVTDEDTAGWEKLNAELLRRFGVDVGSRYADIALPPFATNWTVLRARL
jgi:hypothetical protein